MTNINMLLIKYRNYLGNTFVAFAFYTFPAAVIVGLYGAARRRSVEIAVLACATIGPLLILAFAWDLSRFLVGSIFSALIAALYMETVRPAARISWPVPVVGWIVAALLLQVPFTYAYFEVAEVSDVGPASLRAGPIGRLTENAVAFYSRAVGPIVSEHHGNDPLPAGDVWYVE